LAIFPLPTIEVIGSPITALPCDAQVEVMLEWAQEHASKSVCVANTHMLIEAHSNPEFMRVLRGADLVTPDGMPLVWMMKLLGARNQNRVAGMDIFLALCQEASHRNLSVFFVGSQTEILNRIQTHLEQDFPDLCIAGMEPLPFRPITPQEDDNLIRKIHASGASLVLVSLGCPKQEVWMSRHKGQLKGVMIGLGGVFPVYAGIQKRAPQWAREYGLEWLYRLLQEPKRLWKRYQSTIPPFIYLAIRQLIKHDQLFTLRSRLMQ
jgi:N-acetylglucosaminyldiphosphoundecaprenol N-acetyl-beta-D-mannosaminyltransferase